MSCSSCGRPKTNKGAPQDHLVTIHYRNPIEGYNVSITIDTLDKEMDYSAILDHYYPADIYFQKNDSVRFVIHTERYYDRHFGNSGIKENKHYEIDSPQLDIVQNRADNLLLGPYFDYSFLFFDIDFDGEKELLVNQWGGGQYGVPLFEIYDDLSSGKPIFKNYPPFTDIDCETRIDVNADELFIYTSGGAGYYSFQEYKKMMSYPIKDTLSLFNIASSEWERNELSRYYLQDSTDLTLMKIVEVSPDSSNSVFKYYDVRYKHPDAVTEYPESLEYDVVHRISNVNYTYLRVIHYFWYDINRDGNKELWVLLEYPDGDWMYALYNIDSSHYEISELASVHVPRFSTTYKGKGYLLVTRCKYGEMDLYKLTWKNGLKIELIDTRSIILTDNGDNYVYPEPREPEMPIEEYDNNLVNLLMTRIFKLEDE